MRKGIYTYYKERLIEIGGNNKCLYLKGVVRKSAYDLGKIFEGREEKIRDFISFLFSESKFPFTVISQKEKKEIIENLELSTKFSKLSEDISLASAAEAEKMSKKIEKAKREAELHAFEQEILKLKELSREIDEIEKETGRSELYIGYPFVFGTVTQGSSKTLIKAPLILFPVKIEIPNEQTVELRLNGSESIRINPALVFAYAQSKKINVDQLNLEFDNLSKFKTVSDVLSYLKNAHIDISYNNSKNLFAYSKFKESSEKELSVRHAAVIGRFSLSNSIYNDYTLLEKKKLTNDAIDELLLTSKSKKKKKEKTIKDKNSYIVKMLDYAQASVVKKVDERGNMVIYGPPGTGKSQTIVNIITDAICKKKRVLVVSQKKAALDVVFNRLGRLSEKAMYITDEFKEKRAFYSRCLAAHQNTMIESLSDIDELRERYDELEMRIDKEIETLDAIKSVLHDKRPFGLSLSEMYSASYNFPKNSTEYSIYTKLIENPEIMALNYKELSDSIFSIKAKSLDKIFYNFLQNKENNPIIDHLHPEVEIRTLEEVKSEISEISKSHKGFFNTAKYPYYKQIMAYYSELKDEEVLLSLVKQECRLRYPSKLLFTKKIEAEIKTAYIETLDAIDDYVKEYASLNKVLTTDGYISVIDNILRGNTSYIKYVIEALNNYIELRDINSLISGLDTNTTKILNFAYSISRNYQNYCDIIDKLTVIKIYHEILHYEDTEKESLSKIVDFGNITSRIYKMKEQQLSIATELAAGKNSREYECLYENAKNNKDYLYQISKDKNFWPIRRVMEVYGEFILSLFPCWILSPENVSSLLPLEKNLFDIVIFDEASQVFIENTIPTIYRGKNIVVAGDAKQLRPSSTFMKRYLGADPEAQEDYSVQAALEVDSLLDLAVARYDSANLTYHYRSRSSELISFSNAAFYSNGLQISPNISKNKKDSPIERYKVSGKWIDRRNIVEAKKIVDILKDIFKTRKNQESIGIITFNSDQQSCIADYIDREAAKDPDFRSDVIKETNRFDNGEDTSLFIKNLENVQGDERDIIIFSIGYAENADGKVYANFGSLSADGGENRLNVAITRARSKIIVVTSIEPEELKVDNTKNLGPKLLRQYLVYVRAVAKGNTEEAEAILANLDKRDAFEQIPASPIVPIEEQLKEKLEKLGYKVELHLGNKNTRISLAVYDAKKDKYLVGVELDKDAFEASEASLERDVYKPKFLESRGWNVIRVWCRDFWLYPHKVVKAIATYAEKSKKI